MGANQSELVVACVARRRADSWATVLVTAAVLGAAAASCAQPYDPLGPPDIVYGEDICDQCGMIISEARFAAASIVEVDGNTAPRRFDDVGDMLVYHRTHSDLTVRRWYVHDYDTEAWLDGGSALFVHGDDIRSPMGGRIAAFSTPGRAAEFAATVHGEVLSFDTLRAAAGATPGP